VVLVFSKLFARVGPDRAPCGFIYHFRARLACLCTVTFDLSGFIAPVVVLVAIFSVPNPRDPGIADLSLGQPPRKSRLPGNQIKMSLPLLFGSSEDTFLSTEFSDSKGPIRTSQWPTLPPPSPPVHDADM